jgi:MFS family permease
VSADGRLIAAVCAAHVLTMVGAFAFPALLPDFAEAWRLSNAEAGWIAGIYFGGYAIGVPVLVALTDRMDARLVYGGGALLAAAAAFGFAALAEGFWSALLFRALAGLGLAATYMPGLKMLVDRYRGPRQSRAIALYTASFSLGTALSYLATGSIADAFGWPVAFVAAGVAAVAAGAIAMTLGSAPPQPAGEPGKLLDFRPVIANRPALGYVLAYGVHCWELFTLRSWLVALLAFVLARQGDAAGAWLSPTIAATLSGLVAMVASVAGNELCVRYGRRRVIRLVMVASALMACGIGFATALPYPFVVILALVYSVAVQLDSAALTAGAVIAAKPGRQGATMALHALIGFACGFVGPLLLGWTLDIAGGGDTAVAWGLAFLTVAAVGVLGPLALALVPRNAR